MKEPHPLEQTEVEIPVDHLRLHGELAVPEKALGVVLFAHGSGSSRFSPRNQSVAHFLRRQNLGTLLFDLLTPREEAEDRLKGHLRFDIQLLSRRLLAATDWVQQRRPDLASGYFGSSTGAAAALVAESNSRVPIRAIVSRGGRPDLAGPDLPKVKAPTLLIVGGNDTAVIEMNQNARAQMRCLTELQIIPGATHLFEEPGTLETVSALAANWFTRHLLPPGVA